MTYATLDIMTATLEMLRLRQKTKTDIKHKQKQLKQLEKEIKQLKDMLNKK